MPRHVARTFQLDPGPSLVRFRLNCLVTGNPPPASPTAGILCYIGCTRAALLLPPCLWRCDRTNLKARHRYRLLRFLVSGLTGYRLVFSLCIPCHVTCSEVLLHFISNKRTLTQDHPSP